MSFNKFNIGVQVYKFNDKPMPIKDKTEYNAYMKTYLPIYRKMERDLLTKAKNEYGWTTPKQKHRRKSKKERTK